MSFFVSFTFARIQRFGFIFGQSVCAIYTHTLTHALPNGLLLIVLNFTRCHSLPGPLCNLDRDANTQNWAKKKKLLYRLSFCFCIFKRSEEQNQTEWIWKCVCILRWFVFKALNGFIHIHQMMVKRYAVFSFNFKLFLVLFGFCFDFWSNDDLKTWNKKKTNLFPRKFYSKWQKAWSKMSEHESLLIKCEHCCVSLRTFESKWIEHQCHLNVSTFAV